MIHGNPTWGFLYRNFVGPVVEAGYRAIVVDHLGFGRSDKPDAPELLETFPAGGRCADPGREPLRQEDAYEVIVPELLELVGRT